MMSDNGLALNKSRSQDDSGAYINGKIYTVDREKPWAEAMLVRNGKIVAVGSNDEILELNKNDDFIDLNNNMVMPGIHDAHIHLLYSGLKFRAECRIRENAQGDNIVEDLNACANNDNGKLSGWIVGGEYNPNVFSPGELDRKFLDEVFPDTPVYLYEYSIHHALVNSKALELAGVDASTPDPRGGKIMRREGSAEPTGELVERATWQVKKIIPRYPQDTYYDALTWAIGMANRYGITSVQEASASLVELELLNQLDANKQLTLHVAAHLVWQEEAFGSATCDELDKLIDSREEYTSEHVRTSFVKCWLDGAPLPPHFTQADIDQTTGNPVESKIVIPEKELIEALKIFDKQGLTLKMHCAGEGSVRVALNAVEAVRKENGQDGPPHEVAHTCFFHPDDLDRFAKNNVIAEMSPAIWHIKSPEFSVLDSGYKFASLDKAGAHVTIGSDWIITPDPNLFPALQGMLERGDESVSLEKSLEMMTISGARAIGLDATTGSIAVGKSADFIILDRNLFEVPVNDIGETNVLKTYFEGKCVYELA